MPKGPALTAAEREEIVALRTANLSAREIALKIERSKTVVLNFLKNPTTYGTVKRSGRRRALSKAQEAQIVSVLLQRGGPQAENGDGAVVSTGVDGRGRAVEPTLSAERIKKEFDLPLSIRRIQQLLADWRRDARKALDKQYALTAEDGSQNGEGEQTKNSADGSVEGCAESETVLAEEDGEVGANEPLAGSAPPPIEAQV